jgi:hypothetical protein
LITDLTITLIIDLTRTPITDISMGRTEISLIINWITGRNPTTYMRTGRIICL